MTVSTRLRLRRRPPLWAWALPMVSLVAAVAIPAFWWYGFDAVRDSTDGRLLATVTDPTAPGYQAIVEPSPTLLVFGTDDLGVLAWTSVIALGTADRGGTMLLVPPETLIDAGRGTRPLDQVFTTDRNAATVGIARVLDMGFTDVVVLSPGALASLTRPLGTFEVDLPDALLVAVDETDDRQVVRPSGASTVEPDDLATVLGWVNPGESPFNRMVRQHAVWSAWLATLAATGDPGASLAGETDIGITRFVRGLASGPHEVVELPTYPTTGISGEALQADAPLVRRLVLDMVPFPAAAVPGDRPRIRLLDGRPEPTRLLDDARSLVAAGAEVTIIGNAERFERDRTTVAFHDPAYADWAQSLRDALGAGEVVSEAAPDNVIDITVTIGRDLR